LGKQCEEAWNESKKIKISASYRQVENIVVAVMGGSALGADIINAAFTDRLRFPLQIISDYTLPRYVGPRTLLILSSYSGTTEEPLAAGVEGVKRGAKIIGVATGGKLSEFLREKKYPAYIFEAKNNPSNQPRMGLGYSVIGQMGLLRNCGLLEVSEKEIKDIIRTMDQSYCDFGVENSENIAKDFARQLENKIPVIVGSEFLSGNVHALANQFNECAKCFANHFILPELNHHLMEGLKNPRTNNKNLKFVLIKSELYHPRNQKRYEALEEVLRGCKVDFIKYSPKSKTKLSQSFEVLVFGSYVSFYLAMLYDIDPSLIPWVDFFKERLSRI
jgi:glucose/mannose-6-phosphate isomerase